MALPERDSLSSPVIPAPHPQHPRVPQPLPCLPHWHESSRPKDAQNLRTAVPAAPSTVPGTQLLLV